MYISIKKGFPEKTGTKVISSSILLHEVFGPYQQSLLMEDIVCPLAMLVVPLMIFKPLEISLKNDKKLRCHLRFSVYSQKENKQEPCLRFINEEACTDKIKWMGEVPKVILHAFTNSTMDNKLLDLFNVLADDSASKTSYFYRETTWQSETTYSIGIINEYGDKGNPHCVTTAFFSIGTK